VNRHSNLHRLNLLDKTNSVATTHKKRNVNLKLSQTLCKYIKKCAAISSFVKLKLHYVQYVSAAEIHTFILPFVHWDFIACYVNAGTENI